jgi:hypothetical protein
MSQPKRLTSREIRMFTAMFAVFFYLGSIIEYHFRKTNHSATEWKFLLGTAVVLTAALTRMVYIHRRQVSQSRLMKLPHSSTNPRVNRDVRGNTSFDNQPAPGSFRTVGEAKKYMPEKKYTPENLRELNSLSRH